MFGWGKFVQFMIGFDAFPLAVAVEPVTWSRFRRVTNSVLKLFNRCCRWTASFDEEASKVLSLEIRDREWKRYLKKVFY